MVGVGKSIQMRGVNLGIGACYFRDLGVNKSNIRDFLT
jgi:hypothetical protein